MLQKKNKEMGKFIVAVCYPVCQYKHMQSVSLNHSQKM